MPLNVDERKSTILDQLLESAGDLTAAVPGVDPVRLVTTYYLHVSGDDLADRSIHDLRSTVLSHLALARERPQGTARVQVFTPRLDPDGWTSGGRTVVHVVTDDMPFLVDSATMALEEAGHAVQLVLHPQFVCRRSVAGELLEILPDDVTTEDHDVQRESWMHIEIADASEEAIDQIETQLGKALQDVREAVEDWQKMHEQITALVSLLQSDPPKLPAGQQSAGADEVGQVAAFLQWLADDHFTFLGYREYDLVGDHGEERLIAVPGTGLGILRGDQLQHSESFGKLPPPARARARDKNLLVLAKANSRATVHRPVHLDYVGVKKFDAAGEVVGERRFIGLFSSGAYTESVNRIPLLREKAAQVIAEAGYEPLSHAGKSLMDVLETYPRDELFQTPVEDLAPLADAVMRTRDRRRLRLFLRHDIYGRFLSCLVYLPRDRYNTAVRERIQAILQERLGGERIDFTARVSESFAARLHFVVRPLSGQELHEVDPRELEDELAAACRTWNEDLGYAVQHSLGQEGAALIRTYGASFPEAYKEDYSAEIGARDLCRVSGMTPDSIALELSATSATESRLKLFRRGEALSLSHVLPMLSDMGVEVVDERPYQLAGLDEPIHIYDFGLRSPRPLASSAIEPFQDAVSSVWDGRNESDAFNALVLAAGLTWRQAMLLRAYARYMQQGGTAYSQDHIAATLAANVDITGYLVQLFTARFDPQAEDADRRCEDLDARMDAALENVARLDQDRVLRSYRTLIRATLRTSYFQTDEDGHPLGWLSFKLDPTAIADLPEPRPRFEIFVYSPRVEGVHLRFGPVARGGLRWSDRQDDFRTEVLGLVKAQMVKNTVIVPVGAKGGFVCKQLPDPGDRDAWMAEGISCYRMFITALLGLTDNLVDGEVVPPRGVVRRDPDDTYLVVAADKGTATFSDIANEVAIQHGFWLGDAFASGGSVGYDHKAMGITAKGAWVSVQRHFRELGVDCQREDFTAVGIGDMSGDVFGNGMLCSERTRLVAAFDHRDIFLDPDPDAATSYAERRRLFDLPRSSWQDYDKKLISEGGGVFSRNLKSIPLTPQVREALGMPSGTASATPAELMRAILSSPVDLLWNGGIGTYVKAGTETHGDAGDKANDAIRVDGAELRCRIVGEGGNLGLTQRGRIEYALTGGRINTDFIDNSAGVDTSDHEVNIKILLNGVAESQDLAEDDRNRLLASMTEEVGALVLADNYQQNLALANAEAGADALLHVHERWMRGLESAGKLNRDLEALPSTREVAARQERGVGLTAPELSVLLAYAKIGLAERLLDSDLADDPFLRNDLFSYFPQQLRQDYRQQMQEHPLRREIVVTQIVNDLVNNAGITYLPRLMGETGASAVELTRANFVAREIFGTASVLEQVNGQDNRIEASVQTRMRLEVRTLAERVSRWLVSNYRPPLDSEALVDHFDVAIQRVLAILPELLVGQELAAYDARRTALEEQSVPPELAARIAAMPPAYMLLGVVETAAREQVDPVSVARVHFELGERLGLSGLVSRILALPRTDRWETMARAALRDDLHAVHSWLTAQALAGYTEVPDAEAAVERVDAWVAADRAHIDRSVETLAEIVADDKADLARLSVGLRVARSLVAT